MMSEIPRRMDKLSECMLISQALRVSMNAENDAVNLYQQVETVIPDNRKYEALKEKYAEIIGEEKVHHSEFQEFLDLLDCEQYEADVKMIRYALSNRLK